MKFILFTYQHQTDFGEEALCHVQLKNLSTFKECQVCQNQLSSMYVSFVPGPILSTLNGLMKWISITPFYRFYEVQQDKPTRLKIMAPKYILELEFETRNSISD